MWAARAISRMCISTLDWEHSRRFPLNNTMRKWFVKTRAPVRNPDNERKIDALVPRQGASAARVFAFG